MIATNSPTYARWRHVTPQGLGLRIDSKIWVFGQQNLATQLCVCGTKSTLTSDVDARNTRAEHVLTVFNLSSPPISDCHLPPPPNKQLYSFKARQRAGERGGMGGLPRCRDFASCPIHSLQLTSMVTSKEDEDYDDMNFHSNLVKLASTWKRRSLLIIFPTHAKSQESMRPVCLFF